MDITDTLKDSRLARSGALATNSGSPSSREEYTFSSLYISSRGSRLGGFLDWLDDYLYARGGR